MSIMSLFCSSTLFFFNMLWHWVIPENTIKTILNAFQHVKGGTLGLFSLSFLFPIFLSSILAKWNENCRMARRVSKPVIIYFVCLCCEVFHPECFEDLWMHVYSEARRITGFFHWEMVLCLHWSDQFRSCIFFLLLFCEKLKIKESQDAGGKELWRYV